ncbi:MAG: 30S ribosomal protein S1 [Phycisphaerales bacterium]
MSSEHPETPAPESAPASTTPAEAAPGTAEQKIGGDPRKGLPPISKATVIRSNEPEAPRQGRGPRQDKPRRDEVAQDNREKGPGTRQTLISVTDESRAEGGLNDGMAAEIDAAMKGGAVPEEKPAHPDKPVIKHTAGEPNKIRGPRRVESGRERRTGTVVSVGKDEIFIEFGPKELGFVPRVQWKEGDELPTVGGPLEVVVDKFETSESLFHCSRPGTIQKAAWESLEAGQLVEARVTGVNKGGLELEVAGHAAFMPAGQVSLDRIADLSVFVGEKFTCQVMQVDTRGRGNILLSRKDLLKQERAEKAKKLKDTLVEGQSIEGTVRKLMPFGAFVDIGGLDGLLHISDLTYDRVFPGEKNVAKYVKEGDHVQVKILKLDFENDKISLGLKQLAADPFATATGALAEGVTVTGRVVRLTEFGAFVELSPGVDGLLHVSEISRKRINKPEDVLKADQVITAKVLRIDPETRRISLSMKSLEPAAEKGPPDPNDKRAVMRADREKRDAERLAEIAKESPELRRQREKFRNKSLSGGFGDKAAFLGGGLGDLKIG